MQKSKGRNKVKKIRFVLLLIVIAIIAVICKIILNKSESTVSNIATNYENNETELTETLTWDISASDDDDVTATLTTDGVLTISGTGAMTGWKSSTMSEVPWSGYEFSLIGVIIEEGVTNIGGYAFAYFTSIESVKIASSVTSIGNGAFHNCNCESLTSIDLPEGLTSIGNNAFSACSYLKSIEIPSSVIEIGTGAFINCDNLISINADEENEYYCSEDGVLFNKNKTTLICYPLGKTNTTYVIPDTVTIIGYCAFFGVDNVTITDIPDSVTSIGMWAFNGVTYKCILEIEENATGKITIDLPDIIKRTLDEEDIMYADGSEPTLTNCTISYDDETMTFSVEDLESVEIYITSGALYGMTVILEEGDLTPPTAEVSYSTTETTNGSVTVTITASEEIQSVSGWTLSSDSLTLTKTYTANASETVTIYDLAGNSTEVTVTVTNIDTTAPTAEVSYSTTETTNGSVTVTITADKKIQEADGWTLLEDGYTLTKEYTENATETITIYDLVGNRTEVTVTVTNIDTTAPTAEVSYSTTEATNGSVTVTITADKEIQEVDGWTLSSDSLTLTKTYTENTSETVTIYDLAGNSIEIEVTITNISTSSTDDDNSTNTGTTSSNSTNTSTTNSSSSTSTSSLPYTGTKALLIGIIAIFVAIAVVVKRKWNNLKGI